MRSPARIDPTLKMIEILWKRHPDMRLGQLLINLDGGQDNLWNLEEDELQLRAAIALADGFEAVGKRARRLDTEVAS